MRSLRTQLSVAILLTLLITVGLIGLFSNIFIKLEFTNYIIEQERLRSEHIVNDLGRFYDPLSDSWDSDFLHIIGTYSMHDGYILKVFNLNGDIVWDAENHNCWHVMDEIAVKMEKRGASGSFVTKTYDIKQDERRIGAVSIITYGPYFMSENDFTFINTMNKVLIAISVIAAVLSIIIGYFLSRRFVRPVIKSAHIAKQIAAGNYGTRFEGGTKTRELNDLVTSVNHLANALSEQENLRKRLTSDVAHELRTPLAAIGSHLEAMIEGIWEATPERLQSCHEEVKRLEMLVADLGQLTNVESGNLKLSKTAADLMDIAQTVVDNMKAEIGKKNMSLSITGGSSFVELDINRINQVITNLVSNAVKYTPDGGSILIEVIDSAQNSTVKVKDNGMGIPESEHILIFERFYRTEKSRNRKSGGAGIGLAIVKSIVIAHGGMVFVESNSGGGSCFTVNIPKLSCK
ncbi:MAG: hypothetical protein LBI42_00525 [Chitinispirillales bacterium]|jgi:signal transduction histidine kinase|nr:hypothetical protein [Chitinispirillales bacterium]